MLYASHPSERCKHVRGVENPTDCISRGLFPKELVSHDLWWTGPPRLGLPHSEWPSQSIFHSEKDKQELWLYGAGISLYIMIVSRVLRV